MKKTKFSILCLLLIVAILVGFVPALPAHAASSVEAYYAPITATSGTQLLAQLHDLITSTHTRYTTYAECGSSSNKTHVAKSDPGSNSNSLLEFYTQQDIALNSFDVPGGWNREHVWPKANSNGLWNSSTVGGGADLHHIRPAEKDLNNHRGNLKYGEVANGNPKYASGSGALGGYANSSTFEPLDNVKGDVARILFYMYTHYNSYTNSIFGGYAKTNGSGNASYFGTLHFTMNVTASSEEDAIALLLKWNRNDPVDEIETTRNDYVASLTGNRNPFIDNANFADAIWGNGDLGDTDLKSISLFPTELTMSVGQTSVINVSKQPTDAQAEFVWTVADSNVATVSQDGMVTAKAIGTTTVTVTSKTDSSISATAQISVRQAQSISISGTPAKTYYHQGDVFDATGLTVTATYNDGSTSTVALDECEWLDGTTGNATLSVGTTSIVCKWGSFSCTAELGLIVEEFAGQSFTIDINSFSLTGSYAYHDWTAGGVSGTGYIYGGNKTVIQLNSSKTAHYINSTTPTNGGIKSVTLVLADDSRGFDWELWTSKTPYSTTDFESGTSHGVLTASTDGVTWKIDSDDTYFSLNYTGTGMTLVSKIIVEYTSDGPVVPVDSVSLDKTSLSLEKGETATLVANATGAVSWTTSDSSVATVENGVVTAHKKGTAIITAQCGTASATCTVSVTEQSVPDRISLDNSSIKVEVGSTATLVATATGTVTWTTSNSNVATVDENGVVTAHKKGTAIITAQCGTASATCTVSVVQYNTQPFVDAVDAISTAVTREEQFDAIKNAIVAYNKLSETEKGLVAEKYSQLQSAIFNYNTTVQQKNDEMDNVLRAFVGDYVPVAALAVMLYLLKRKWQ